MFLVNIEWYKFYTEIQKEIAMKIADLRSGQSLDGLDVLVIDKSLAKTKRNATFCKLTVRDSSGELSGNIWDYEDNPDRPLEVGQVIAIWGSTSLYQGNLQMTVDEYAPSMVPISEFGRQTEFSVEDLWSDFVDLVGSFEEPLTKFVAEELLINRAEVADQIKKAPAASHVHNNWFGGLLEHVWSLCSMAEPIIEHYRNHYQENLSRDKVLFGLMMHDAGKIIEYDVNNPAFPMTGVGLLTNHIVLGPAWVYEKANQFKDWKGTADGFRMERAQLMHVLAAHHGKEEWGSPVKPHTLEALLVHHLDNLDSKMMHAIDLIKGPVGKVPGFSDRSYFERASYYRYQPSL